MVLLDRVLGTQFLFTKFAEAADVICYQHIFWFYSHPGRLHHDVARVQE